MAASVFSENKPAVLIKKGGIRTRESSKMHLPRRQGPFKRWCHTCETSLAPRTSFAKQLNGGMIYRRTLPADHSQDSYSALECAEAQSKMSVHWKAFHIRYGLARTPHALAVGISGPLLTLQPRVPPTIRVPAILLAYMVEHANTRPAKQITLPLPWMRRCLIVISRV